MEHEIPTSIEVVSKKQERMQNMKKINQDAISVLASFTAYKWEGREDAALDIPQNLIKIANLADNEYLWLENEHLRDEVDRLLAKDVALRHQIAEVLACQISMLARWRREWPKIKASVRYIVKGG